MTSTSTPAEINSATQQNTVMPAAVMQDILIDIDDAQDEPKFISGSPQPPVNLIHSASSSNDSSRATPTSTTFSGLQIQQSYMQSFSSLHADESADNNNNNSCTLQAAAYCQPHNTQTIHSAFIYCSHGYGLSVCPYEPCIHFSHQHSHSHTTAIPAYTQHTHLTPTPNTAQTLHLSQRQLSHSTVQLHTVTHSLLPSSHLQSHSFSTLSHSHQPTPATQHTLPLLPNSSNMQPQLLQYAGPPIPMSAGHSVHLAYEPQHRFTLQPQHQVPPTSHTPATTLIEMCPPLPTPLIQLQAPHKPHLIKCGRPIRTPAAHTSLFTCISNTPPTLTDVTPCMTSYTVGTPFSTATSTVTVTQLGSSDVTQATAAKHTTNVTRTEIVCRNNTPVTSVTPASVLPSTNTANNSVEIWTGCSGEFRFLKWSGVGSSVEIWTGRWGGDNWCGTSVKVRSR